MALDATVIGRVAVKVVPDTTTFRDEARAELAREERAFDPVSIDFEANISSAVEAVNKAVNEAQRVAEAKAINLRLDLENQDEVAAGIRRVQKELDRLKDRTTLRIDLNEEELRTAEALLKERLDQIATLRLRVDQSSESSVRSAIAAIDNQLSEMRKVEIEPHLDVASLRAVRDELEAQLLHDEQVKIKAQLDLDNSNFAQFKDSVSRTLDDVIRQANFHVTSNYTIAAELDDKSRLALEADVTTLVERLEQKKLELTPELNDRDKERIKREINDLDAQISVKIGEASERFAQGRLALLARRRIIDLYPEVNKAAEAKAITALAALSGGRAVGKVLDDLNDSLRDIDKNVFRISNVALAVTNLGGSLIASTGNALSFIGSLSTMAQASLALPGILGGLALGLGATVAVFKDFNTVLPNISKQFGDLQNAMSTRFWAQAAEPIQSLVNTLFPQFQAGMLSTTSALGTFFSNFADSAKGVLNGELGSMFDDLATSIKISGQHTDSLLGIIQKLGSVGAGNLPRLATFFGNLMDDFDNWLGAQGPAGLQSFIDNGTQAIKDFGGVLHGLGSALAGLYRGATAGGGSTLAIAADTLNHVAKTINSTDFQKPFIRAFAAAHEGMDRIASQAGDDFKSFVIRLVNVLDSILPTAGDALGKVLDGVFSALDTDRVESSLVDGFHSIDKAVGTLAPSLKSVTTAMAGVVDVVGALVVSASDSLAPLLDALGPKVDDVAQALIPLIDALGQITKVISTVVSAGISILPAHLVVLGAAFGVTLLVINKVKQAIDLLVFGFRSGATGALQMNAELPALQRNLLLVGTAAGKATTSVSAFAKSPLSTIGKNLGTIGIAAGIMALQVSGASDKMGLANATSGALLGTLAGPWGAVIGFVGGAFLDLQADARKAEQAMGAFNKALADPSANIATISGALKEQVGDFQDYSDASENAASSFGNYLKAFTSGSGRSAIFDTLDGTNDRLDQQRDKIYASATEVANLENHLLDASVALNGVTDGTLWDKLGVDNFNTDELAKIRGLLSDPINNPDGIGQALQQMQPFITQIQPILDRMGASLADLTSDMDANQAADFAKRFNDAATYLQSTQKKFDDVGTAIGNLGSIAMDTTVSAKALGDALNALLDPNLNAEKATDAYRTALQGLRKTFSDNGAAFSGYSKAALDNRDKTRSYVDTVKDMLVAQAQAGDSSVKIAQLTNQARNAFIREGTAVTGNKAAIVARANAMGLTPKLVTTIFKAAGLDLTKTQIDKMLTAYDKLPRNVRVNITNHGVPETMADVKKLKTKYDLVPSQVKTLISLIGTTDVKKGTKQATDAIKNVARQQGVAKLDITGAPEVQHHIDQVNSNLAKVQRTTATATVNLIDHASSRIATIRAELANLNQARATVTVEHQTIYSVKGTSKSSKTANLDPRALVNSDLPKVKATLEQIISKSLAGGNKISKYLRTALGQNLVTITNVYKQLLKEAGKKGAEKYRKDFQAEIAKLGATKLHIDGLLKDFDTAKAKLKDLQTQLASYKKQIVDSFNATADPTALGATTYDGIVRGLQLAAQHASQFDQTIKELIKAGLNDTTIQQLIAAGPEQGLAAAQAILSGGVDAINSLQHQIKTAAHDLADHAGNHFYGDVIRKAGRDFDALVAALAKLQKGLREQIKNLLDALRADLAKEVKKGDPKPGKPGTKSSARTIASASPKSVSPSATAAANGTTVISSKTLIYNAAPGRSLDSEEDLFEAIGKAGGW